MSSYTEVLEFFMENGIQLSKEQMDNLREICEVITEKADFSVTDSGMKFKGVSIKVLSDNKKQTPDEIKQMLQRDMEDFNTLYTVGMRNMIKKLKFDGTYNKMAMPELEVSDFEKRLSEITVKKYGSKSTNFRILFKGNKDPKFFKGQDVALSISISLYNTVYHTKILKNEEDMKKFMYKEG